jgi:hypothetical protein
MQNGRVSKSAVFRISREWGTSRAQAQKRLEKRKRSDEGANGTRGDSPGSPTKSILNHRETRSNLCV